MLMPYYLPEKRRKTLVNWYRYKVQSINCIFFSKLVKKYIYNFLFSNLQDISLRFSSLKYRYKKRFPDSGISLFPVTMYHQILEH